MPSASEKPLSAFERRRLENRQANNELISELSEVASKILPVPAPTTTTSSTSSHKRRAAAADAPVKREQPTRRTRASARLAGIEADSEVEKRKFEAEHEAAADQKAAKRYRVSRDLVLGEIGVDGKKWDNDVQGLKDMFRGAQPGVPTFSEDDIEEATDETLKKLRVRMGGLALYEKPTPAPSPPSSSPRRPQRRLLLLLRLLHPQARHRQGPLRPGLRPRDPAEDAPISALDAAHADPQLLYFSTLQGLVGRVDLRDPANTVEQWVLSEQKIGGFSLHPTQPHLLATASLDRTVKIWDLRKMSGSGDDKAPALVAEHPSRLSVSHAAWGPAATSPLRPTTTPSKSTPSPTPPTHVVPHNNQTGRWVTILKPQWQQQPHDGIPKFVIGNMNRFVDVYAADGRQLAQLNGDGISAVPAVAQFHPTLDWVAGGTASGKLCLWM
ncbi:unnamed protein product [Parascedosporium putredinis]|uniref:DNA damage-binding protein CMR1 n=1 Tax=Parascedosporium putredinis TaxID=1442378 RepID=A0A9P1GWL5_9PEZI|nr:unnamed protein product [Parascedosporium putredinis]CAI7988968.1 unnamed protein product [Parascedosporium putredinis]